MARSVGIGLVGYGGIGRMHALCYRMLSVAYPELPPVRVVAVQTATPESAARAAAELGDVLTTTDLGELLAHPGVDVVDCCAPTGDHARVAEAAVAAGKALFWEKPLGATAAESEAIVRAAGERGLAGGVNFHFRQVPALQEAARLCRAGALGEPVGFHLRYHRASNLRRDRPISWRFAGPGSGVLADLGAHMIDMALHLLGPAAWVSAETRTLVAERPGAGGAPQHVDGEDAVWLQLGLRGGGVGSISASKVVPGAADDVRVEAYGTAGALTYDARDPNGLLVADLAGDERRVAALSRTRPPASLPSPETPTGAVGWHIASVRAFLGAYLEGRPPEPGLADGLAVDRVIDAARRSAAGGGARVAI